MGSRLLPRPQGPRGISLSRGCCGKRNCIRRAVGSPHVSDNSDAILSPGGGQGNIDSSIPIPEPFIGVLRRGKCRRRVHIGSGALGLGVSLPSTSPFYDHSSLVHSLAQTGGQQSQLACRSLSRSVIWGVAVGDGCKKGGCSTWLLS